MKGQPAYSTTGAASRNSAHGRDAPGRIRLTGISEIIAAMATASSGRVSVTLTQNRRLISRNSGLSSSTAAALRGSSAIPQIGQEPGRLRTISGCIGQVYSVRRTATDSGSSDIPQDGQAPGLSWRTSGHIGQT